MTQKGITLVELIIVLSIIAILMGVGAYSYQGWMAKFEVEREIMDILVDVQQSRHRILSNTHTPEILVIHPDRRSYTVYEDRNGDGAYTADADHPAVPGPWPRQIGLNRTFWMTPAANSPPRDIYASSPTLTPSSTV